ncbi:MAG: cell division protein FtsZ [Dysgonamonadaceae bacterium]|jgi:cell division protein FtsZ|nr:cell division protein FtsZ [Dysgonamonadaceae bacterium]
MDDILTNFDFPTKTPAIIKVIGVGGGGGNAVTHMHKEGIKDVTFVLCNTDNQALLESEVRNRIQLGKKITEGLGAGNKPHKAKAAAEESIEDIRRELSDGTKMAFVTAGMGGGTGTGAAPIVAKVAKDMGILTVGIVTIPFLFEGKPKILQALRGVEEISKNVDALLVINNERLREIYSDLDVLNAFKKADDTLTIAAKSIAEIITLPGHVNLDFADVNTILRDGGVAIMSTGFGEGIGRVSESIENALNSPLLNNNDVFNAKKILFNIYFSSQKPLMMEEMNDVNDFMAKFGKEIEVIWGATVDETLGEKTKVTILATGFGIQNVPLMEEVFEERANLSREEERKIKEEERRQAVEEERMAIYEAHLLEKYYGKEVLRNMGKTTRPQPFIFSLEQMDDDEIIEAVINHPTYNRSPKIMLQIAEQAEARLNYEDPAEIEDEDIY